MDICLVNMPYFDIARPSLALGTLQSLLESAGFSTKTVYANLTYANDLGIERYLMTCSIQENEFFGDWTFSPLAFPDFAPDNEAYLSGLMERNRQLGGGNLGKIRQKLLRCRQKADCFLISIAERILEEEPSIVGCSSTFQQHVSSLALLKKIRSLSGKVVTLLGGGNCETVMGLTAHKAFTWVDYLVSGEAEDIIINLTRSILNKGVEVPLDELPEGVLGPIHRIQGYPRNRENGSAEAGRATNRTLDGLPAPNYKQYFETLDKLPAIKAVVRPGLPIQTSRGCWWSQKRGCLFCGLNGCGTLFRSRPYMEVIRELDTLSKRYGLSQFSAVDNVMDLQYFKNLLPSLKRAGRPYRLFYEVRPNLTRYQVKALQEAGVLWIQPGIESLHSKVLSLMNKGTRAWQNILLLKWCCQFGIHVIWHLMFDFPGEKDGWYQEMAGYFHLLTHLQPPAAVNQLYFYRYSRYHSHSHQYGLRLKPLDSYRYVYPLSDGEMNDLAYLFQDVEPRKRWDGSGLPILATRPGLGAVLRERYKWVARFWSDARPVLVMTSTKEALLIRDTRPGAVASAHAIRGLEKKVYLACDKAPTAIDLLESLEGPVHTISQIERAVRSLVKKKLMMAIDGRLIALAVNEPLIEIPAIRDYPGGAVSARPAKGAPEP